MINVWSCVLKNLQLPKTESECQAEHTSAKRTRNIAQVVKTHKHLLLREPSLSQEFSEHQGMNALKEIRAISTALDGKRDCIKEKMKSRRSGFRTSFRSSDLIMPALDFIFPQPQTNTIAN